MASRRTCPSYDSVGLLFLGSFLQGFSRCPLLDERNKSHAFLVFHPWAELSLFIFGRIRRLGGKHLNLFEPCRKNILKPSLLKWGQRSIRTPSSSVHEYVRKRLCRSAQWLFRSKSLVPYASCADWPLSCAACRGIRYPSQWPCAKQEHQR